MSKKNLTEETKIKQDKSEKHFEREKKTLKFKGLNDRQKSMLGSAASGLAGVAFGAVAMSFMGMGEAVDENTDEVSPSNTTNRKGGENDMDVPVMTDAPFSEAVNDEMTFNEAFAAARRDVGPGGFFEWQGETYNTYYKEEWDALSQTEKDDFFASLDQSHSSDDITDEEEILNILNDEDDDIEEIEDIDHEDIVLIEEDDPYEDIDDGPDVVIDDPVDPGLDDEEFDITDVDEDDIYDEDIDLFDMG